jgi:hypothetical protein
LQLPSFLAGIPKTILVLVAVPIAAFVAAVGLTLGMNGGDDNDQAVAPTLAVSVSSTQPLPTANPQPAATPQIRTSCSAIQGTDYRSPEERLWYQQNCSSTATSSLTAGNSAGSSSSTIPSGGSTSAPSNPPATGHYVGAEYALGDQLVIPSIGLNAAVTGMDVGADGVMPDPAGYFNAVWYNFASIPGLGGYVSGGNLVLAGHVDCARCYNGGSGTAVFWNTRNLSAGDTIQYYSGGQVYNYEVFLSAGRRRRGRHG